MNKAAVYILISVLALLISFLAISGGFSFRSAGIIVFFLIFIPVLIYPEIGLVIIIVSMLFSPEIIMGQTTARFIAVRAEDIILIVVVLAWFIKTAFTKDIVSAFKTPLTGPFFLYIGVCIFSTLFAALFSAIDIKQSVFAILKYVEYFLFFIMVRDCLRDLRQTKIFVTVFLITALAVSVYSNVFIKKEMEAGKRFFRVAPPVETRQGGEAGTLGGYLLFMMAIAGGLLLYTDSGLLRISLICLELIMFRAFLYTLSRGSYIALIPAAAALICLTSKWRVQLIYTIVAAGLLVTLFAPQMVRERITTTLVEKQDITGQHMELEESPRERLKSWKLVFFERFPRSPIFGHGVAKFFIDGQVFLTLCEVGIAGLIFLAWMLIRLFKAARRVIDTASVRNDGFSAGLSVGFLAGFVGLFAHAFSTNTFILIKIMEPFWFMAAIVLSLPRLLEREKTA